MKKQICCLLYHSLRPGFCAPGYDHIVIDTQRDPETIEARTEIGSARRNANGNLLHRSVASREHNNALRCESVTRRGLGGNQSVGAMPICKYVLRSARPMKTESNWIDAALLRDFEAEGTDAHRLCTIEDGWVERFGRDVLISFKRVLARERLIRELQSWASDVRFEFGAFSPGSSLAKMKSANLRVSYSAIQPRICRQSPPRTSQVRGRLRGGLFRGFFVDQRENRRHVRHIAPKRLLNCFAYTCSFSVSAAYVGAPLSMSIFPRNLWRGVERILR